MRAVLIAVCLSVAMSAFSAEEWSVREAGEGYTTYTPVQQTPTLTEKVQDLLAVMQILEKDPKFTAEEKALFRALILEALRTLIRQYPRNTP